MAPPMGNAKPIAGGFALRSRKRKRAQVPTRYSKRVAARARKKRRFFGQ